MLKKSFFFALILALGFMTFWELYWRSQGFPAGQEDNKGLWALTRARLDRLGPDDVVILGSSRAHFDFQLDVWEEVTGVRPLQLAADGKTPGPFLQDVVENTDFNGTLVIGVAPGLFFGATNESSWSWKETSEWLEYYYEQTYAQKLCEALYIPVNAAFAFVNGAEESNENQLTLKTFINNIPLPTRIPSENDPQFPFFVYVDADRNAYMLARMETDTAYARRVKNVWAFFSQFAPAPEVILEEQPCTLDFYKSMVMKFTQRGGKIVFVRNPAYGIYTERESTMNPRAQYWDSLLTVTGCPGYHFKDHEFMDKYELPEWSHMSVPQAREYTRNLVTKMVEDGYLGVGH